jgi:uncharacterized Zn finger protein
MHCTRCRGLMVQDHFMDFEGTSGYMWARSWRCMNCGHVHDPIIEQNRRTRPQPVTAVAATEPDYEDEEVHLGRESYLARVA